MLHWLEHPRAQRCNAERVLLSARLIEPMAPGGDPSPAAAAEVAQALSRTFGFSADDLADNRAGVLSAPQRHALRRRLRRVSIFAAVGVMAALVVLADSAVRPLRGSASRGETVFAVFLGASAMAGIGWVLLAARRRRRAHLALWRAAAPVLRVTGAAKVRQVDSSDGSWSVTIGDGPAFHTGTGGAHAFLAPYRYAVNFLPGLLLSAEPVPAQDGGAAARPPPPEIPAAVEAALAQRLSELARARRARRVLLAMLPAALVTAGTVLPYALRPYDPDELKLTLTVVAVWVLGWTVYAVWGRRRR